MTTIRLQSSFMVHAPGILAWGINGYRFEEDRPALLKVFTDAWPQVSAETWDKILKQEIPLTVDKQAETVTIEVPDAVHA